MTGEFTLRINLGNDTMQTTEDVARTLRQIATHIEWGRQYGPVMDANGNNVGEWSF